MLFERPGGLPAERHELRAECLDDAKLAAAILYALCDGGRDSYLILGPDRDVVYIYPER